MCRIISFLDFQIGEIPIAMLATAAGMVRDECYCSGSGPCALSVCKGLKSQSVSLHSFFPRKPHAPFIYDGPIPQCVCVHAFIVCIYNCMGMLCWGGPTSF